MSIRSVATVASTVAASIGMAWVAGPAFAASSSASATQATCGTFGGPGWTRVDPMAQPVNQSGTRWKVIARGVACPFAMAQAKVLVKTPFKGEALTKLKSPKGWTCVAGGGYSGGGKGTSGTCNQGRKQFGWGPSLPSS